MSALLKQMYLFGHTVSLKLETLSLYCICFTVDIRQCNTTLTQIHVLPQLHNQSDQDWPFPVKSRFPLPNKKKIIKKPQHFSVHLLLRFSNSKVKFSQNYQYRMYLLTGRQCLYCDVMHLGMLTGPNSFWKCKPVSTT